jgi:hypothetical protein
MTVNVIVNPSFYSTVRINIGCMKIVVLQTRRRHYERKKTDDHPQKITAICHKKKRLDGYLENYHLLSEKKKKLSQFNYIPWLYSSFCQLQFLLHPQPVFKLNETVN